MLTKYMFIYKKRTKSETIFIGRNIFEEILKHFIKAVLEMFKRQM